MMKTEPVPFQLWLETETDPEKRANRPRENYCNILVSLADGREFALRVWTFDFLPLARHPRYERSYDGPKADFVLPPDLFVESLDRQTLERVVTELLATEQMKEAWLVDDTD